MKTKRKSRSTFRSPGRRNRKLRSQGFQLPMRTAVVAVLLGSGVIFYLLVCSRNEALASQIKNEEHQLELLRRQVASEEVRWNDMIGPRSLQAALRQHNLNMRWPRPDQVVHIRDMALWESGAGETAVFSRLETSSRGVGVQ